MLMAKEELGIASRWGWIVLRGVVAIVFGLLAFSHPGAITLGLTDVRGLRLHRGHRRRRQCGAAGARGRLVGRAARGRAAGDRGRGDGGALAGFSRARLRLGDWRLGDRHRRAQIATAVKLRKVIDHEWTLGLAGAVSVAFGLLMLFRPIVGGLAIVWWLGAYAMVFGILMIVLGFKLHGHARRADRLQREETCRSPAERQAPDGDGEASTAEREPQLACHVLRRGLSPASWRRRP